MKIINRYILEECKMPIIFGVSLFTFIFLIEIIVSLMENIIVKGISLIDVIRILSFYLPPILSQTIPMGVFLGIMITFSKFTRTSESTAMSSIGMDLKAILKPIVILAVGITLFIFFLQESIIPRSFKKLQEITLKIAYENPVFQLKERTLIDEMDNMSLYIDKIDHSTKDAKNILIIRKTKKDEFPTIILGRKAFWKNTAMVLQDADFYSFDENGKEKLRGEFKEKKIPLSAYFQEIEIKVKDIEALDIGTLLKDIKTKKGPEKIPYLVEINRKIAIPLSTIILTILGAVMSIGHHRSGKGASFGISLGVIFGYIVFLNVGMVMAYKGKVSPYIGVWTPNVVLSILTMILYRKKARGI
ncbi:lipopolysaccharide export system permease protein [Cetobacterium ceti]|uniref:Lipopolysaccharide export system permease protein n=1 Tax=Cetobacterium ceti TaxID=180163 RepID=A0A1T4KVK2_9FUSO|nr:LptF/LptG family permease [Cetobacterium ceti]SJZ46472.1 lipopolysaccharide export system permease protein [Cetobacterium ceti]